MDKIQKTIGIILVKMAGILIAGGVIGTFLLILVYCIPTDRIYAQYQRTGIESIESRDGWHKYLIDYDASTLDNNTEWLMLKIAATPLPENGENIVQKALRGYTLNEEWYHGLSFTHYTWKGIPLSCDSYERYWHGYVVFLKPLMLLFSYTDLIFLNIGFQMLLIYAVFVLLRKRNLEYLRLPFLILLIVSMQLIIALSLDYSVCFYIYMGAVAALLWKPQIGNHYLYFFLIVGMITSYMDLFTWPLITLAVPLLVFCEIRGQETRHSMPHNMPHDMPHNMLHNTPHNMPRTVLAATASWGIGYVGQWGLKWVIATLILKENVIKDAGKQILYRSSVFASTANGEAEWISAVKRNVQALNKPGFWLVFLVLMVWLVYWLVKRYQYICVQRVFGYLLIGSYPFIWYMFTGNHSNEHWWMTWRILCISIFSVCCLIGRLSCESGKNI